MLVAERSGGRSGLAASAAAAAAAAGAAGGVPAAAGVPAGLGWGAIVRTVDGGDLELWWCLTFETVGNGFVVLACVVGRSERRRNVANHKLILILSRTTSPHYEAYITPWRPPARPPPPPKPPKPPPSSAAPSARTTSSTPPPRRTRPRSTRCSRP